MSKKSSAPALPPEWTHYIETEDITPTAPITRTIEADEETRTLLARRVNVEDIQSCSAQVTLTRENPHRIHVQGMLHAQLRQLSVKSLTPLETKIEEPFEAWYADLDQAVPLARARQRAAKSADGEQPMLEEHEDPEPITDGRINLGELAAQYLSLTVNPYPKDPAEADEDLSVDEGVQDENPFAKLSALKNRADIPS